MGCMFLLYSSLMACYLGTGFDTKQCDDPANKFRPIYTFYDCGYCSKEVDPLLVMVKMYEEQSKGMCK